MTSIKIFILSLYSLLVICGCNFNREEQLIKKGNALIKKIEQYKKVNNKLPPSLLEIGVIVKDEADPPFYYEIRDSINYTVSFGTTLGESKIYYSDSKEWEDFYRVIKFPTQTSPEGKR